MLFLFSHVLPKCLCSADKCFIIFIYHIVLVSGFGALFCNPVSLCSRLSSSVSKADTFSAGEGLATNRAVNKKAWGKPFLEKGFPHNSYILLLYEMNGYVTDYESR